MHIAAIILFLFCGSVAYAANKMSQQLLTLSEQQRNAIWTKLLRITGDKCDVVVKTMFQGGGGNTGRDIWSVGCNDGNEYAALIEADAAGTTTLQGCKEVKAIDEMLMARLGKKPDGTFGFIFARRQRARLLLSAARSWPAPSRRENRVHTRRTRARMACSQRDKSLKTCGDGARGPVFR